MYGLKLLHINSEIELIEETPANLADLLMNDEIDLGLIPVAAIPQLKQYFIAGDYCISTESESATELADRLANHWDVKADLLLGNNVLAHVNPLFILNKTYPGISIF